VFERQVLVGEPIDLHLQLVDLVEVVPALAVAFLLLQPPL
jgi:hypothetical protein